MCPGMTLTKRRSAALAALRSETVARLVCHQSPVSDTGGRGDVKSPLTSITAEEERRSMRQVSVGTRTPGLVVTKSTFGMTELDCPRSIVKVLDFVGDNLNLGSVFDSDQVLHDGADDGDHA